MSQPRVSVIIPAYNEEAIIRKCLESLVQQQTQYSFEVIVVDNRSTDGTGDVAREFSSRLDLKVIREERQGRGSARARGFREARGAILFSTDADAVLPGNWIQTLTDRLKSEPEAKAITGPASMVDLGRMKNALLTGLFRFYMQFGITCFGFTCLNGFNFAIRRETYEQSGGFDPEADAQEDMDLTLRVRKLGKILYTSCSPVISGRRFKRGVLIAWYEYGSSFVLRFVFGKRRVLLRNVK